MHKICTICNNEFVIIDRLDQSFFNGRTEFNDRLLSGNFDSGILCRVSDLIILIS